VIIGSIEVQGRLASLTAKLLCTVFISAILVETYGCVQALAPLKETHLIAELSGKVVHLD
jgi:hypothetical protein